MLALDIEPFTVELKEGSLSNVGPTNKSASAKLFDVESADVRAFGDKRVKFEFDDAEGNEVQVALFPETVRALVEEIETLEDESSVFEG
ncbi:hypothetical protein [Halovivax limisalsi]|uniref:hypothetical protein n=1 Tax=Halovivax limisalsi TaxID=1453760 RepID=UPI001FFC71B0|nr:hypothetical protein [Halovivax limisalsi]